MLLSDAEDIDAALPFFKAAVVTNPKRIKERKITSLACYHLSLKLLSSGRRPEAERYYRLGEKTRLRTDRDRERYDSLRAELFEQKLTGRLYSVIGNKGYGFIEREDAPGQTVFVHVTQVAPKVSNEEFKNMQGAQVSFTIEETEKGPKARNVRLLEG
jgi:cold shock CspA family protein